MYAFSLSLLAHGSDSMVYLSIGGNDVLVLGIVLHWFPDRVIISFKVRNVVGKGCIPHFL
jgi:hypothetical protein